MTAKNSATWGQGIYTVLAAALVDSEPTASIHPHDPCYLPWDKVVVGFSDLKKRSLLTPNLDEDYARLAILHKDKIQAGLALRALGDQLLLSEGQTRACFVGPRAWTQDKAPWPDEPASVKVKTVGWEENGHFHPGSQIPARKGVTIRSDLYARLPNGRISNLKLITRHPVMTAPDGAELEEHASELCFEPGDRLEPYRYTLSENYEVKPGRWSFEIVNASSQDTILLKVPFELK